MVLAALDSAGLPVVGGVDALLIAVSARNPHIAYPAAMCAIVGSLFGSLVLFTIARRGGEVLLAKHVSSRLGARMHAWFQKYGLITVFVPALSPLPLPMKVPVLCAGALQVRISYFISVVLIARTIRYFALAYLGQRYGQQTFLYLKAHAVAVTFAILGIAIVSLATIRLVQKQRSHKHGPVLAEPS